MKNWIKTLSIFIIISPIISAVGKGMDKKILSRNGLRKLYGIRFFPKGLEMGIKRMIPISILLKVPGLTMTPLPGRFIHGHPIGISSRIMKRKMERISGLIFSAEDMAAICRELSTNLITSKISAFRQFI